MKLSRQMKKSSMQALDSDRSACMAAICYSGPISAVPTNEQHFGEKQSYPKFKIYISKTERRVCVYTNGHGEINSSFLFGWQI